MILASQLLEGKVKVIASVKAIQTNHGKHLMGYIGVSPISESGESFTVATELEFYENENYTEYDGFKVENDTKESHSKVFAKIEGLIESGKLSIN